MKTKEQMLSEAEAECMTRYSGANTVAIRAALDAGIVDGDVIGLGGNLVATISQCVAVMSCDGRETGRLAISAMTDAQRERMLYRKAVAAGAVATSYGTIKV